MIDCFTCDYANRDSHGRFKNRCDGYGNCSYEEYKGKVGPTMIEQMQALYEQATMAKFGSIEACNAYRKAIKECIMIVENE